MVQSFLVDESTELIYDDQRLSEWKQKCEELGLTGQLDLASPEKSPIPFENMNTVSQRVYETLCPVKVDYKEYKKTAIPLEVLSLIHLSVNEGYFESIQIWYDDKSPDPLAVGSVKVGTYQWEYYLIARWGDVLRPFDELREMAIARCTESTRTQLQNKISEAKHKLENVELNVRRYIAGEMTSWEVCPF